MLAWTLQELAKFQHTPLKVDETLNLTEELKQRFEDILDASPFKVKATLTYDEPVWILDARLVGTVEVPSTRSLEPVEVPIDDQFTEIYVVNDEDAEDFDDSDVVLTFEEDRFDLKQAVEDNIFLSIPTQVLTPEEAKSDIMPKGTDWEVISETDYLQADPEDEGTPNPEFEKLKQLFPDSDQVNKKDSQDN